MEPKITLTLAGDSITGEFGSLELIINWGEGRNMDDYKNTPVFPLITAFISACHAWARRRGGQLSEPQTIPDELH